MPSRALFGESSASADTCKRSVPSASAAEGGLKLPEEEQSGEAQVPSASAAEGGLKLERIALGGDVLESPPPPRRRAG